MNGIEAMQKAYAPFLGIALALMVFRDVCVMDDEEGLLEAPQIVCIYCGCTEEMACPGGCAWVDINEELGAGVCSSCAEGEG